MATWPNLHVSQHPAVRHKLGDPARRADRAQEVPRGRARAVVAARLRGARRRADAGRSTIQTPIEAMAGEELADRIGLDPDPARGPGHGRRDARADADGARSGTSACSATSGRCGRSSTTTSCPTRATVDLCLILDPMLATGGSATAAIEVLKRWGAGPDQAREPDRGAGGRRGGRSRRTPTSRSTAPRSTASSTTRATSCRASATPAIASSGRATPADG